MRAMLAMLGLDSIDPLLPWAGLVILGFPLLTFILWEAGRRIAPYHPEAASWLRTVQNLLLPATAAWIILRRIAPLPQDGILPKLVDTLVSGAAIYVVLGIVQLLLLANRDRAQRAPKLLIDLGRLMLVAVGVALVISDVWGADLGSLFTALGVGSVVLGFALQGVVGGMVHGVILISGRHFAIGDMLKVGETTGRVAQIDWLAVTLETAGSRVVIPSGDLAQKTFTVIGPRGNPRRLEVDVVIGFSHAPEHVRHALLHAASGVSQRDPAIEPSCRVRAVTDQGLRYSVSVPLASPLGSGGARHELLSRFWYIAQRESILLGPEPQLEQVPRSIPGSTVADRLAMLARNGALGMPGLPMEDLAAIGRYERWRPGEALIEEGGLAGAVYALDQGELRVLAAVGGATVSVQRLTPGDLFAARTALRGDPSLVRVEAVGEVAVLALPIRDMQPLLGRSPALARIVELALEAQEEAVDKVLRPARGRAA